ncbi:hypothetical protein BD410DRAFT_94573 [Rickenella mellea]|uniref:Uncharacterized protein n=1 Tax=Rickenella mellea TaxID=50990 RepID=A0A4Y7QCJ5_9AGAM|nr:hypothetical protein BD410DRAFT_94573 [Rickenella mellea]
MSKTGRSLEDGAEEPPAKRIKVEEILVARSLPTTKRKGGRQPQKTGEERAKELLKDTRLAAVEPQQVLCRMCGNWIRLFKHVDYAPANWRSHALKCEIRSKWISQVKKEPNDEFELSLPIPEPPHQSPSSEIHPVTVKEENPNSRRQMKSLQERRSTLADDKRAAYPEPHRVFCKLCSSWVRLHNTREYDLFNWSRHVEKCELKAPGTKRVRLKKSHKENNQRPSLTLTFRAGRTQNPVQTVDVPSDPIPSPIIPKNEPIEPPMPSTSTVVPSVPSAGLLKRKPRNILERLKDLEMDPRCGDVRESEVFCLMCQKWVKLSRDVPYIDANWIRHASRCSEKNWLNPLVRALSPFDIKPDIDKLDSDALEVEELCFRPVNSTPDLELRQSSKPTDRPALPTTNDEERKQAMLDDPRCSDVQPFNVTCNMCSRQIGLHGKKAYFISNWLRHAESCEAKSKRAEGPIEKPAPSVLQLASVSKRPDPPNAKPAGPVLQLAPDFIPSPAVSWNILKEHENEHSVKHRRSRDQRAQELLNDDRIGEVEPHRVLCKICKEWVGLHNSKEYFSYTWYKHVDRCEQKRKGITPKRRTADTPVDEVHHVPKIPFSRKTLEERKTQLESDPRVGDVEPHRIHCKVCDKWLKLNNDIEYATFNWFKHISKCDGKTASPVKGDVGPSEKPAEVAEVVEVPPPPKTKTRTTAQEREVKLRQDPRLVEVEAHRCLCGMCGRWLKLQNKIEYDAHNWLSHAIKCEVKTGWKPGSTLNATSIADPDPEGLNAVKVEPSTSTPELLAKKPCPPVPRPRGRPPSFKVKPEPTTTSIGTPLDKFVRKSDAQREAELRADPRQKGVERGRVLCGSCDNWIKLNYQHSFLPGNWLRHAERCHGAGRADVVKCVISLHI